MLATPTRIAQGTFHSAGCWRLFGLHVYSEVSLPGDPVGRESFPDVTVRYGQVPPRGEWLTLLSNGGVQLEVQGVGRFQVMNGSEIIIDPAPDVSLRNLRVFLLGSAMGALLHQRGLIPLHANAVVIGGRAVAFMGRSGSGKSTLAAWFQNRGFPLLSDDVLAVSTQGDSITAFPGVPRLRIWDDALKLLDQPGGPFERCIDGQSKFDVPITLAAEPTRLHACYVLEEGGTPIPDIDALNGVQAVEALIANTYRGEFVRLIGKATEHAQQCIHLASRLSIFRVERTKDVDVFEQVATTILSHAERGQPPRTTL